MSKLYLAIDVGTGGIRSALVDARGKILAISHKEHEQIVPQHGWSEQRPADWWSGTKETIRDVLARVEGSAERVAAIGACGQMHGSVLIDENGQLTREATLLWNDKRTLENVQAFEAEHAVDEFLHISANMPAPAWPAFKLMWLAKNDPESLANATTLLMPKDYINYKLTGERAQDWTEASMSFLMDATTSDWSDELIGLTGVRKDLLPDIKNPATILGGLNQNVADQVGLPSGLPVIVGSGDYPMALLGSGVCTPGMASDVTGTSTIITVLHDEPKIDPEVSNLQTATGAWGSLTLLDSGGDAVRWARRAFHENRRSYGEVADAAQRAEAGSNGLFFLPYLSGERFGDMRNSRAQFFGLSAGHGLPEIHRAVLEGVAFSVRQRLASVQGKSGRPEMIVASSGGAKSDLWLEIKASMYNVPYLVPEELECGVVGCAAMMATATGDHTSLQQATKAMVRYPKRIEPNQEWVELYDRMMPIYSGLYEASKPFYASLDNLK